MKIKVLMLTVSFLPIFVCLSMNNNKRLQKRQHETISILPGGCIIRSTHKQTPINKSNDECLLIPGAYTLSKTRALIEIEKSNCK